MEPTANSVEFGMVGSSSNDTGATLPQMPVSGGDLPAIARPRMSGEAVPATCAKTNDVFAGAGMQTPTYATSLATNLVSPARSTLAGVVLASMSAQVAFA